MFSVHDGRRRGVPASCGERNGGDRQSREEGVVLMLKWKWVGLYGHTLPTSLWISF